MFLLECHTLKQSIRQRWGLPGEMPHWRWKWGLSLVPSQLQAQQFLFLFVVSRKWGDGSLLTSGPKSETVAQSNNKRNIHIKAQEQKRDRQSKAQTDRKKNWQRWRQRNRQTERQLNRKAERESWRQWDKEKERKKGGERKMKRNMPEFMPATGWKKMWCTCML